MSSPEELAMARARGREPKPCTVRYGSTDLPGLLLEWRPKRQRGGVSRWEGLVIYASWEHRSMSWQVTQQWVHGDMLHPVGR